MASKAETFNPNFCDSMTILLTMLFLKFHWFLGNSWEKILDCLWKKTIGMQNLGLTQYEEDFIMHMASP